MRNTLGIVCDGIYEFIDRFFFDLISLSMIACVFDEMTAVRVPTFDF